MTIPIGDNILPIENNLIDPLYKALSKRCADDVWDNVCESLPTWDMKRLVDRIYLESVKFFC